MVSTHCSVISTFLVAQWLECFLLKVNTEPSNLKLNLWKFSLLCLFEPDILRFIDGSQSRFGRIFRSRLFTFVGVFCV